MNEFGSQTRGLVTLEREAIPIGIDSETDNEARLELEREGSPRIERATLCKEGTI
jgi:hypothetical protein